MLLRPKRKLSTCADVNTNRRLPISQPAASISVRQAFAHVRIIDLAGELTSSAQVALLKASQQASSDGVRVVILNFSHVAYKNSSGIKSLVALLARCNAAGQRLFAIGLNAESQNIFEITQLNQGITVYACETENVLGFRVQSY